MFEVIVNVAVVMDLVLDRVKGLFGAVVVVMMDLMELEHWDYFVKHDFLERFYGISILIFVLDDQNLFDRILHFFLFQLIHVHV
jgi:hypothetical protein